MKKAVEIFVGIDMSKARLDVAVYEQKETTRFSNEEAGIANLMKALKKRKPKLIVLEPTGGFEMLVVAELSQAGLPVAVGAVARHLAEATFWILSKQEPYREPICQKSCPSKRKRVDFLYPKRYVL